MAAYEECEINPFMNIKFLYYHGHGIAQAVVTSFPPWQARFNPRSGHGKFVAGFFQVLWFPPPILISPTAPTFITHPAINTAWS
jgi:hypothetical protein